MSDWRSWRLRRRGEDNSATVVLTCLSGDSCAVYFEPWGSEHVLAREDAFTVSPAPLEVSYVDGGISLWFGVDEVVVTNRSGERLAV